MQCAALNSCKEVSATPQRSLLTNLKLVTLIFDVSPAGDDARSVVDEVVDAGKADGTDGRLHVELDRHLQAQDGNVVERRGILC